MKSLISQRDILRDIRDGVATWTKVANSNIPVFNLYNYQPLCCHNEERLKIREFIDDFMNGINLENVASQVETVLKHFFKKKTLSTLVFFLYQTLLTMKTWKNGNYFQVALHPNVICGMGTII